MKNPSASNAEAFVRCTSSHVLPQHEAYLDKTEKGTSGHKLISNVINRHPGAAAKLTEEIPALGYQLAGLLHQVHNPMAEKAYVVDVQKRVSTFLGIDIDRKYEQCLGRPLNQYEIGVSLDVHGFIGQTYHWVRDFKFGVYSSWWQLFIQSMAVLWCQNPDERDPEADATEVDAGFIHVKATTEEVDGQELESVDIHDDTATIYLTDLDDRADELMTAFGRARSLERMLVEGVSPNDLKTIEGKWCEYCGAYPHCPSKWKLAKAMLDMDIVGHVGALTLEQCGVAWKKLTEIEKKIVKTTKAALRKRMADEDGFPLASGKKLVLKEMPGRDGLDRAVLMAILRQYNVPQEEINSIFKPGEPYMQVFEVKDRNPLLLKKKG